ncbi:MAG: RNA-processing protein [Candidatus Altiarchaeales archaeon]|nr:RNA-processing protein [Candidatus Altiarchaeales archaeon]
MQAIRVPQDRVGVLVGKDGETKTMFEEKTHTTLKISGGVVEVTGDPVDEYVALAAVHAVARGFNPKKALKLLDDNFCLVLVDLKDFASTPKSIRRLKGRVIGERGRTRKYIERSTGTYVCVYGKTVGIIGPFEAVEAAKHAVNLLLSGAQHATAYRELDMNQ